MSLLLMKFSSTLKTSKPSIIVYELGASFRKLTNQCFVLR